jgi:hypothetical protein
LAFGRPEDFSCLNSREPNTLGKANQVPKKFLLGFGIDGIPKSQQNAGNKVL